MSDFLRRLSGRRSDDGTVTLDGGLANYTNSSQDTFSKWFAIVSTLPHVSPIITLDCRPICAMQSFKQALYDLVWGPSASPLLSSIFNFPSTSSSISQISFIDDSFFFQFADNTTHTCHLDEGLLIEYFYTQVPLYSAAGKPWCVTLDVALASGGSEAIAESAYSVIASQQHCGGQSNDTLTLRSKLDWNLPDNVSQCTNTIIAASELYIKGKLDQGLKPHKAPVFVRGVFGTRGRLVLSRNKLGKGRLPIFD